MKYFTSDLHLGEDRIGINGKPNLFYRPFKSIEEQNFAIIDNLQHLKEEDELYIIGDVVYDLGYIGMLNKIPKCKKHLIIGNYDVDIIGDLQEYFHSVQSSDTIKIGNYKVYLNHYPTRCLTNLSSIGGADFAITGHIHGLWKVQKNMINVSTDAWHFKPVSEDEILFCYNAMINYYDKNVFPFS